MNPRILFVSHESGTDGGAARSLLDFLEQMAGSGFDPILAIPEHGTLSKECEKRNISYETYVTAWWLTTGSVDHWLYSMGKLPSAVKQLCEIIQKHDIRLVHTNSAVMPAGAFAAALHGVPHVWHVRERVSDPKLEMLLPVFPFSLHSRIVHLLSSAIVTSSVQLEKDYSDGGSSPIFPVYSGIDPSKFEGVCYSSDPTIVAIGTTTRQKGLSELIDASILLREREVKFRVIVLGEVEPKQYRKNLIEKLKSHGLDQVFRFQGFVSDIRPFLSKSRVLCQPSRSEGMSRVILEAMAAGIPVVCTDSGGPVELVDDGKYGLLVPVQEPNKLADALEKVLKDDELAQRLSNQGRARANQSFNLSVTSAELKEALLTELKSGTPSQAAPWCELLLNYIDCAGPRVLIGKKWALLKRFL